MRTTLDDGTPITINDCDDPRYPDCYYISVGDGYEHSTFIIRNADAQAIDVHFRGRPALLHYLATVALFRF